MADTFKEKSQESGNNKAGERENSSEDAILVSWEDGSHLLAYLTADRKLRVNNGDESPATSKDSSLPSTDSSQPMVRKKPEWTFEAIELFLSLMLTKYPDFDSKATKKLVWEDIASEMVTRGYRFTDSQVSKKWLNMMESYRRISDRHIKFGESKSHWQYYNRMQQIMAQKEGQEPQALAPAVPTIVLQRQSALSTPTVRVVPKTCPPPAVPVLPPVPPGISLIPNSSNPLADLAKCINTQNAGRGQKRRNPDEDLAPPASTAILRAIEDLREDRRNMFNALTSLMRQKIQVSREMSAAIRDIANCKKKKLLDS